MVNLPWGFSPTNAIKQIGGTLNPTGGVPDYDIFTTAGAQKTGVQNNQNPGWMYYDNGLVGVDANGNRTQVTNDSSNILNISNTNGGSGSGSGSGASYNPQDLAYLDSQKSRLQGQYGKADTALSQGLKELLDSYNNARSDANFQRGRELENLGLKREDTTRAKDKSLDRVNDNARTLRDSLLRRIGMASGSDSSAYRFAAPTAVAREASGQRGDVMEDFGVNFRNLALTERRAEEDYDKLLEAIDTDKRGREGKLRSGIELQRQGIDESMAELEAQRQRLLGGGYNQVRSALAPIEDRIASRDKTINSLFDKYRTVGKFNPVKVNMPNLRDYMFDKAAVQTNEQAGTQDPYAPYRPQIQDEEELLV